MGTVSFMAGTETLNFSSGNVPISFPQGLRSGVSEHTRLQYGISDPGVPELVSLWSRFAGPVDLP